jgi:hypothetical protein
LADSISAGSVISGGPVPASRGTIEMASDTSAFPVDSADALDASWASDGMSPVSVPPHQSPESTPPSSDTVPAQSISAQPSIATSSASSPAASNRVPTSTGTSNPVDPGGPQGEGSNAGTMAAIGTVGTVVGATAGAVVAVLVLRYRSASVGSERSDELADIALEPTSRESGLSRAPADAPQEAGQLDPTGDADVASDCDQSPGP